MEAKLFDTSLETPDEDLFPGGTLFWSKPCPTSEFTNLSPDFLPQDEFNISSRFSVVSDNEGNAKALLTLGHYVVQWRRFVILILRQYILNSI